MCDSMLKGGKMVLLTSHPTLDEPRVHSWGKLTNKLYCVTDRIKMMLYAANCIINEVDFICLVTRCNVCNSLCG